MFVLKNDVWYIAAYDFGCVRSRTLWVKFKFSMVKLFVMVVYGPTEEDVEERERFWNDFVTDRISKGYKLGIMGDLNGCVGNKYFEQEFE